MYGYYEIGHTLQAQGPLGWALLAAWRLELAT
jgi:hypothetical protein